MGLRSLSAMALAVTSLLCGSHALAQQDFAALQAVKNLNLPNRPGEVELYYSACCEERAVEIQKTLEDYLRFYAEKLEIHVQFSVAVLDKQDWNRVQAQFSHRRNLQETVPPGLCQPPSPAISASAFFGPQVPRL